MSGEADIPATGRGTASWLRDAGILQRILDESMVGVMIIDSGRHVRYANSWLEKRWAPAGSLLPGGNIHELIGATRYNRLHHAIDCALDDRQASWLTHYLNRSLLPLVEPGSADNRFLFQNLSIRPLVDPEGGEACCLLEVQDVSAGVEREGKLHRQAVDLARARDELQGLTRAVTNDLRLPLHMMSMLPIWIEQELRDSGIDLPPAVCDYLGEIKLHCDRMDLLFSDLADYSTINGSMGEPERIDLGAFYRDLLHSLAPRPEILFEQRGDFPVVMAVPAELELILRHLVSNAIEHHDDRSVHVTIGAESEGKACRISVTDDGPGIPANLQSAVFELFRSLKPRGQVSGTGIGLTMVKKIIEARGGRVELLSPVSNGRGTRTSFLLPLAAERSGDQAGSPNSTRRLPAESTVS